MDLSEIVDAILDRRAPDDDAVIVKQWVRQGALLYNLVTRDPMENPVDGPRLPYSVAGILLTQSGDIVLTNIADLACFCCKYGGMEIMPTSYNEPDYEEHICHLFNVDSAVAFCTQCRGHRWTDDPAVVEEHDRELQEKEDVAEDEFYRAIRRDRDGPIQ
jgi:hypothetical protein